MIRPFRIERRHAKHCKAQERAVDGQGGPYLTPVRGDPVVFCNRFANPDATRGKWSLYIRVQCNDIDCPSTALVHLSTALEAIGLNAVEKP